MSPMPFGPDMLHPWYIEALEMLLTALYWGFGVVALGFVWLLRRVQKLNGRWKRNGQ